MSPASRPLPPRTSELAALGQLLEDLLGRSSLITVFFDGENHCLEWIDRKGVRATSCHEVATALLRNALGVQVDKECRVCQKEKPLTQYSRSVVSADGHLPRCKTCERLRVKMHEQRKRAKAALLVALVVKSPAKQQASEPRPTRNNLGGLARHPRRGVTQGPAPTPPAD